MTHKSDIELSQFVYIMTLYSISKYIYQFT